MKAGKQPRIFISYPSSARDQVEGIALRLRNAGLQVFFDKYSLDLGQQVSSVLFQAIESSDYFLLFLDKGVFGHSWLKEELEHALSKDLYSRDISIVPVLLGRVRLPQILASRTRFDLTRNPHREIDRLIEYLKNIPHVSFDHLTPHDFEGLVFHLLKSLKFTQIEPVQSFVDKGYDFRAVTTYKDPFGGAHQINWVIQVKLYRTSRPDISSLRQLSYHLSDLPPSTYGLLITNGQVTSTAREWLEESQHKRRGHISIIDGVTLKDFVLRHPDLVERFFRKGV